MPEEQASRLSPRLVAVALALGLGAGGYAVASAAGGSSASGSSPVVTIEAQNAATDVPRSSYDEAALDEHGDGDCPNDDGGAGAETDGAGSAGGSASPSTTPSATPTAEI